MRTLQVFIDYWFESVILPDAKRVVMTENQRTILIIDDCPEDRNLSPLPARIPNTPIRFWRKSMGKMGWLCRLVKPDAILLDFLLPDIDGLEFLDELKNQIGRTSSQS